MRLAVLGATGGTGLCLVSQALDDNHQVTAVVRDPGKITTKHDNLKVVKADIFSENELADAFKDHDAVMSCLGAPRALARTPWKHSTFYEDSAKSIVGGLRKSGVNRFVCVTATGAKDDPRIPWLYRLLMRPLLARGFLNSIVVMEEFLYSNCQDINFTIVKPPGLTDDPLKDGEILALEDEVVPPGTDWSLPRANVAKFMLECLSNQEWDRKRVAFGLKK